MNDPIPKSARLLFLKIADIVVDHSVQPREATNPTVVKEYEEMLRDGKEPPPLLCFKVDREFILAAGFHRLPAARDAGRQHVESYVIDGTLEDAILYAAGTNRRHGLQRSAADKRRAVHMVLNSGKAKDWTVEKIAGHCDVSEGLVKAIKQSTPWQPSETLFGPAEDETPPAPDLARVEVDPDRVRTEERMFRAGRKWIRFAQQLGIPPKVAMESILLDIEEREARGKRAAPKGELVGNILGGGI